MYQISSRSDIANWWAVTNLLVIKFLGAWSVGGQEAIPYENTEVGTYNNTLILLVWPASSRPCNSLS